MKNYNLKIAGEFLGNVTTNISSLENLKAFLKVCSKAGVAVISGASGRRIVKRLFNNNSKEFFKPFEKEAKEKIYNFLYKNIDYISWEELINDLLDNNDIYIIPSKKLKGTFLYNNSQGSFFNDLEREDKNPIKLSKILRELGVKEEKEITKKIELWNSYYNGELLKNKVEIINDLEYLYNLPHAEAGTIGTSCMRGRGHNYEGLKKAGVKALAIIENNTLKARALLWEGVEDENEKNYILLDRVYYSSLKYKDAIIAKFKELYQNGLIRVGESYDANEEFLLIKSNETKKLNLTYNLCFDLLDYNVPYLDTFKLYDNDNYILYNVIDEEEATHRLTNTTGDAEALASVVCGCCGSRLAEGEAYYSDYHDCYLCEFCSSWSEVMNTYLSTDDETLEVIDADGDAVDIIIDDNNILYDYNMVKIDYNGRLVAVSNDDAFYFEYTDSYYLNSEITSVDIYLKNSDGDFETITSISIPEDYTDDEEAIACQLYVETGIDEDEYKFLGLDSDGDFILKDLENE